MTKKPITNPEISERLEQMNARADRVSLHEFEDYADEALRIIHKFKPIMEKRGLRRATCHCKFCGTKDSIFMFLGTKPHRGHLPFHFQCKTEGCGFMMLT